MNTNRENQEKGKQANQQEETNSHKKIANVIALINSSSVFNLVLGPTLALLLNY